MTSSGAGPTGPPDADLREELGRVEAERADLLRQAEELRGQLGADAGPMDAADRAVVITQAEELEGFAAVLERRRDELRERLGGPA
jgi:hypothetical protein